jgi:hypothetical protein
VIFLIPILIIFLGFNYFLGSIINPESKDKNNFCTLTNNTLIGFSTSILGIHLLSFITQNIFLSIIIFYISSVFFIVILRQRIKTTILHSSEYLSVFFAFLAGLAMSYRDHRFGNPDNFHMFYTASLSENNIYPPIYPADSLADMSHYHYGVDLIGSIIQKLSNTNIWDAHSLQIFVCVFFTILALISLIKNYQQKFWTAFFVTVFVSFYTSINSLDFLLREIKNISNYDIMDFLAKWLVMSWTAVSHLTSQLRLPAQNSALIFCFLLIILSKSFIDGEKQKPNILIFTSASFCLYFCFPAFYYPICGAIFFYFIVELFKSYKTKTFNQNSKNLFLILVYCVLGKFLTFTSDPANLNGVKTLIFSPSFHWYHWGKAYLGYFYSPAELYKFKQGFDYVYSSVFPRIPIFSSISFREFGFCGLVGLLCYSFKIYKKKTDGSEILLISGLLSMIVPLLFEFLPRPIETTRFLHWTKIAFVIYLGLNLPMIYELSYGLLKSFIKNSMGLNLFKIAFWCLLILSLIPGFCSILPIKNFLIVSDNSLSADYKNLTVELKKIHKNQEICLENIPIIHGHYLSELAGFYGVGGQMYKGDSLTRQTAIYLLNPLLLKELNVDYLILKSDDNISSRGISRLDDKNLFQLISRVQGTQNYYSIYKFVGKTSNLSQQQFSETSQEYSWIIACDLANKLNPVNNELGVVLRFNSKSESLRAIQSIREQIKASNPICAFWLKEQALSNVQ